MAETAIVSIRAQIAPMAEDLPAARKLCVVADALKIRIIAEFNGTDMFADPGENAHRVINRHIADRAAKGENLA